MVGVDKKESASQGTDVPSDLTKTPAATAAAVVDNVTTSGTYLFSKYRSIRHAVDVGDRELADQLISRIKDATKELALEKNKTTPEERLYWECVMTECVTRLRLIVIKYG